MWIKTEVFSANGKTWRTDEETLALMRQFRTEKNAQMVAFVFHAGLAAGRIVGTEN